MNIASLFSNEADITEYPCDTVIFNQGDAGDAMYVVVSGEIGLRVGRHEVERISVGELFGEMALIDNQPRSATAVAVSDARLARIDENRFAFLVQQTPFFALHVMRVLASRLRMMDDTLS